MPPNFWVLLVFLLVSFLISLITIPLGWFLLERNQTTVLEQPYNEETSFTNLKVDQLTVEGATRPTSLNLEQGMTVAELTKTTLLTTPALILNQQIFNSQVIRDNSGSSLFIRLQQPLTALLTFNLFPWSSFVSQDIFEGSPTILQGDVTQEAVTLLAVPEGNFLVSVVGELQSTAAVEGTLLLYDDQVQVLQDLGPLSFSTFKFSTVKMVTQPGFLGLHLRFTTDFAPNQQVTLTSLLIVAQALQP